MSDDPRSPAVDDIAPGDTSQLAQLRRELRGELPFGKAFGDQTVLLAALAAEVHVLHAEIRKLKGQP